MLKSWLLFACGSRRSNSQGGEWFLFRVFRINGFALVDVVYTRKNPGPCMAPLGLRNRVRVGAIGVPHEISTETSLSGSVTVFSGTSVPFGSFRGFLSELLGRFSGRTIRFVGPGGWNKTGGVLRVAKNEGRAFRWKSLSLKSPKVGEDPFARPPL